MRRGLAVIALAGLILMWGLDARAGEAAAMETPPVVTTPAEEEPQPPKPDPVSQYFASRCKDFLDIFNLKLALGDGTSVLAHARATRGAQIGAGHFRGTKVGFEGPSAGIFGEGRYDGGISIFYWSWIGRKTSEAGITQDAVKTNRFFGKVDDIKAGAGYREFYDSNRPWYTVGFAFALPFLPGLEAEMNPAEAVDFVVSLFGIRGFRIPPPFYKTEVKGERVPHPYSIRWHGQEDFEQYD
jgi:hypothetical protein